MISSSIPSTSRMTSISLPFRTVFLRVDDWGETEVLIVSLLLLLLPSPVLLLHFSFFYFLPLSPPFFFVFAPFWLRAHASEYTCAILYRAIEAVCVSLCVCARERANVFVHYWWVPESPFHLFPSLQTSRLAHGCTPPSPLCDFAWQFVSLNVWWHVHLLLLYI